MVFGQLIECQPVLVMGFFMGGFIPNCYALTFVEVAKLEKDMDRRQFLLRTTVSISAVVSTSFISKAWSYCASVGYPLLIEPTVQLLYKLIAFPLEESFCLRLTDVNGKDVNLLPNTFSELLTYCDLGVGEKLIEYVMQGWYLNRSEAINMLNRPPPEDWTESFIDRRGSPSAQAYNLLYGLDLGPRFNQTKNIDKKLGNVSFIDSSNLGCSMLLVEAANYFSLSLLQARFNALSVPIKVELVS